MYRRLYLKHRKYLTRQAARKWKSPSKGFWEESTWKTEELWPTQTHWTFTTTYQNWNKDKHSRKPKISVGNIFLNFSLGGREKRGYFTCHLATNQGYTCSIHQSLPLAKGSGLNKSTRWGSTMVSGRGVIPDTTYLMKHMDKIYWP